ncbi:MAG TPA: adenylyl-sulfate kinase [Candidatus Binatia bacterium]
MAQDKSGKGFVIWIIGLASAGKSTLARLVEQRLLNGGHPAVLLEPSSGEELKRRLMPDLGFDRDGKIQITRRLGYVARLITQCGGVAVVPWITPEREPLEEVRREIGRFVEVYVRCPLDICKERDHRGIYVRAETEGHPVPGVTEPFEPPVNPEVAVDSTRQTPEEEVSVIMERLKALGYLDS